MRSNLLDSPGLTSQLDRPRKSLSSSNKGANNEGPLIELSLTNHHASTTYQNAH